MKHLQSGLWGWKLGEAREDWRGPVQTLQPFVCSLPFPWLVEAAARGYWEAQTMDSTCRALLYRPTAAFSASPFCLIKDNKGQVTDNPLRQGGFWR